MAENTSLRTVYEKGLQALEETEDEREKAKEVEDLRAEV